MEWKNNQIYPDTHEFTQEELLEITDCDVAHFLKKRAHGKEDPNINDDHPTLKKTGGLECDKWAISHFMPCNGMVWNMQTQQGNPT